MPKSQCSITIWSYISCMLLFVIQNSLSKHGVWEMAHFFVFFKWNQINICFCFPELVCTRPFLDVKVWLMNGGGKCFPAMGHENAQNCSAEQNIQDGSFSLQTTLVVMRESLFQALRALWSTALHIWEFRIIKHKAQPHWKPHANSSPPVLHPSQKPGHFNRMLPRDRLQVLTIHRMPYLFLS